MGYPSWRYHASKEPVVALDAESDAALGPEWADSPAMFEMASESAARIESAREAVESKIEKALAKKPSKKVKA